MESGKRAMQHIERRPETGAEPKLMKTEIGMTASFETDAVGGRPVNDAQRKVPSQRVCSVDSLTTR